VPNRLTLGSMRNTIALVLGTCPTDTRVVDYTNEAQERLMSKGKWVGTTQRIRICLGQSCLALPRQVETVEAWALCDTPGTVRDKWYEFVSNGPGQQAHDIGSASQLIDRGATVLYRDLSGTQSLISVQAMVAESASARLLLLGYDENGEWVRTEEPAASGTWIDGEYVAINTAGTRSVNKFTQLTGVVKPATNGPVSLSEWPVALGSALAEVAFYEADETLPSYRRYLVPNLENTGACCNAPDNCTERRVTMIVKLAHIPVTADNDFLILTNRAALKLMVMALLKEQRNLMDEASLYEGRALRELEAELSNFEGDGAITVPRFQSDAIFGGAVESEQSGWSAGWAGRWPGCCR